MDVDYTRLEKNLIDMVLEQQAKLGYMSETVRLYYPLDSLNRMLGTTCMAADMCTLLEAFGQKTKDRFGGIRVSCQGERFCLLLPPRMSDYVHGLTGQVENGAEDQKIKTPDDYRFILDFVRTISAHDCTIDTLRALFASYAERIHFEKVDNGDFDYLLYFEDGRPDDYRYCIADEGIHLTYHRYTPDDYRAFGF